MRFEPPSLISPWRGRPGDLDGLLSEFFRAEMPHRWTAPEMADEQPSLPLPAPKPQRRSAWRSRFALAASVTLLLGGFGVLGSKFKDTPIPRSVGIDHNSGDAKKVPVWREGIEVDQSGQSKFRIEFDGLP
jgi:hypothetical protein